MRKLFLMAMTATLVSTPALAEPETGSRLSKNTRPGPSLTPEAANRAAQEFANCMVLKRASNARSYLLARDEKQSDALVTRLMTGGTCPNLTEFTTHMSNSRQVSFPTDILRGKLAESLLRSDRDAVAGLTANPVQKQYSRTWYVMTGRHSYIDEMATCVADSNPHGIGAMLATLPDSKDEMTAFKALVPSLPPCLRAGANLTANRQALRAALAEGLWQRIHAPIEEQQAPVQPGGVK